jgi:hypothetical protein
MARKKFPTFWIIVLIIAVFWFFKEMGIFELDIPWLPLILIVIAAGAIVNKSRF